MRFFSERPRLLLTFLFLIVLGITLQNFFHHRPSIGAVVGEATHYGNYLIFKNSFVHLIHYQDIYAVFPEEHVDLYKYSPAFAVLMAPFAILPDFMGLLLWNGLNAFVLFLLFWKLSFSTAKNKLIPIVFILIEAITSLQNSQSNCLIAGLIIGAYLALENNKMLLASLALTLVVFIKLFGIVAFALFLIYPQKRKAIIYTVMWMILFTLLPLLVVAPEQLWFLYKSWGQLLASDHSASYGLSVMGWFYSWFHWELPKNILVLAGAGLFCLPLLRRSSFSHPVFRLLFLSSILLWVVIFNHKAESPTFIIAVAGVAIWFFNTTSNPWSIFVLFLVLVFTILSPTDMFPKTWRNTLVIPYVLKAVPCIVAWGTIIYYLLTMPFDKLTHESR